MAKTKAILITFFLGVFGIHRFMAGKAGTGLLWLVTGGLLGLGWIADVICVCTEKFTQQDGTPWVTE